MEKKPSETTKPNPDWERLQEVIESSGMSVHAFALHIGLPRSENLYQIKKGNHGISKMLAEQINQFFPEFSVGWLLAGENSGNLRETAKEIRVGTTVIRKIPVYHDFKPNAKPIHHIFISGEYISGAEFVLLNKDETLSPKIPAGALVLVKPVKNILPGKYYLIVTEEFTIIRKVAAYNKPDEVIFCTTDREGYDDFSLNRSARHKTKRLLHQFFFIHAKVLVNNRVLPPVASGIGANIDPVVGGLYVVKTHKKTRHVVDYQHGVKQKK